MMMPIHMQNMYITLEYAEYVKEYAESAEYEYPPFRIDIPSTVWTYPLSYA
jgi:hypothetical protein